MIGSERFSVSLPVVQTGRRASVVLVHRGQVLGLLPPVVLELPWWPEADDLVTAVRERDGIEITVLRLLRTTSDRSVRWGGHLPRRDRPATAGDHGELAGRSVGRPTAAADLGAPRWSRGAAGLGG